MIIIIIIIIKCIRYKCLLTRYNGPLKRYNDLLIRYKCILTRYNGLLKRYNDILIRNNDFLADCNAN